MKKTEQRVPISVAIVTKNEESTILAALESVKDFDDIIVVDACSNDGTVDLCRRYTERVFTSEWKGFSAQKQTAVDYARNQWVLILDADERVTPDLKTEMIQQVRTDGYDGFYIPRKNFFLGKWIRHSGWWPDYTLRLFKKSLSHMEQREVHEKVVVDGLVGHLKGPLEHYSYRTISDYMRKMETYSLLAAKELYDKGVKASLFTLVVHPLVVFCKMFFLRQGFRDGTHGFILAGLYSFYTFLKYLRVWEKKITSAPLSL